MRAALDSGDQRSGARRTAYVDRGSDQASLPGVETPARFEGHDRRPPRLRRKTQAKLEERIVPTRALFLILVFLTRERAARATRVPGEGAHAKLSLRESFAIYWAGDCAHCVRNPPPFQQPLPRPPPAGGRKLGRAGSDLRANRCRVRVPLPHLQCDRRCLAIRAIPRDT